MDSLYPPISCTNEPTPSMPTVELSTLVELLRWRALRQPEHKAYTFLLDGEVETSSSTYRELDCQARAIGAWLQSFNPVGERALLLYPPGLEFMTAFFGCLYAGVVAVPAYPPRPNQNLSRLQPLVADAQATFVLTTTSLLTNIKERLAQNRELAALRWLATDNLASGLASDWQEPTVSRDTLAFLQYTSGSTGTPKGVMVSHGNLLHNERIIQMAFGHTEKTLVVGWLPLFHDMGLIGNMLQPLYLGIPCILMAPIAFLQRPLRWLQAISRYQATTSGGPNFAYELCLNKITAEQRETLDLSSWEVAFNGAEPIRAETLERFARTFAPCGFRRQAFYPCYGMAETTLIVSGGCPAAPPVIQTLQGEALARHQVVPVNQESGRRSDAVNEFSLSPSLSVPLCLPPTQTLVGCGQPLEKLRVIIVHPQTSTQCAPDEVGEIWVAGESVAQGYWNRQEETEQIFRAYLKDTGKGPFFRTGDLGYLQNGELFITGRLKDLIIIRGRNHYPQDIERTVEQSHLSVQPNCAAAFSLDVAGEERLVVCVEVQRSYVRHLDVEEAISAIRQAVAQEHELQVYGVMLLKPGSLPKTSSGKIQRHACRASFLDGSWTVVGSSILEATSSQESTESLSRETILAIIPSEQPSWLVSALQQQVAGVLKISPSQLPPQQPLTALGIDSLMAVELKNSIETQLGIVLPMTSLLEGASIAQLASELRVQLLAERDKETLAKWRNSAGERTFFTSPARTLSYNQRSLWFMHQLAPESAAYNIAQAVRIRSEVDRAAWQRAFQKLVERHAALRTTFKSDRGEPVQQVGEGVEVCFQLEASSSWSEDSLNERLVEEAHRPFNLERDRLMRVYLLKRAPQEYILLLVVHHIVTDFWSLAVMVQELGKLYQAEKSGTSASLLSLGLEYTDYTRWQTQMLASPAGSSLWAYWQQQLAGELPVLALPTDYPRPPIQTYRGAAISFQLSAELTSQLKALSCERQVTLYMTLLAAFGVLLHRYTGQEDLLVGSPTAGRSRAELSALVGYFVNPVVLRADLSGNPTFDQFLAQVCQTALDAFAHQDYPLALLVEKLQLVRDPSRSPLFQTMFVWQKAPLLDEAGLTGLALGKTGARMLLGDLEVESLALEQRVAQFDLTLMMAQVEGELAGVWEYNADLFEADTIGRMVSHFQTLLEGIVTNPQQNISTLPLLTAAERHQLLVGWNETQADYPKNVCIHQLFAAQVERTPDAVAVVFEDEQLTYLELNERANRLAHYLQRLGVGPEVLVGICLERSLEMVVGVLGILKIGAAYVPLDPAYPLDRLSFMVEDAQISVLLTQQSILANLQLGVNQTICLDSEREAFQPENTANPTHVATSDNLAYVIYTSGSTGQPKGVMVPHASIVNRLLWGIEQYQLTQGDHLLQKTSLSFDVSVWEILGTLLAGACLILARPGGHQDPAYLVKAMAEQQITHVDFVPAMLKYVLDEPDIENCSSLRYVTCGGESLSVEVRDRFFEKLPGVELHNCYGPTEVSIDATTWVCERYSPVILIGRPIANQEVYLLDGHLQPVPIGVAGELYIGGAGLARGYLNRPDLTAEKFIRHPFNLHEDTRLYRTGDLARFLPNGNIEFLGRLDEQIKLRGFRIELREIEMTLSCHPDVDDAVVVVRSDANNQANQYLLAYLVSSHREGGLDEKDKEISIADIRTYLSQQLPEYMLPSAYVSVSQLPRTPSGKLDYHALSLLKADDFEVGEHFVPPQTALEQVLAGIWTEVLQVERIGVRDNFFNLGGHSLLAIQVNSRLREIFSLELPLHSLFEATTIEKLSQLLITQENKPGQVEKVAQILQTIDSMSAQEIQETLQQKQKEAGRV